MPLAKRLPGLQEMAERIEALEAKVQQLTDAVETLVLASEEEPRGPMSLDDV